MTLQENPPAAARPVTDPQRESALRRIARSSPILQFLSVIVLRRVRNLLRDVSMRSGL